MDWQDVDPERLFEAVRARGAAPDAERTVWAFERALAVAAPARLTAFPPAEVRVPDGREQTDATRSRRAGHA